MTQESYPASTLHAYPGGPAAWIAAMSAKANREASVCAKNAHTGFGLKSATRGGDGGRNEQSTTVVSKTAGAGGCGRTGNTLGPNQTEQRYRDEFLVPRIVSGEIAECVFEGVTLILSRAERCRYTPDFWVRLADGRYEAHEVKGKQVWEDSRIKVKWAAQVFPNVRFVWGQWRDGKWKVREVRR